MSIDCSRPRVVIMSVLLLLGVLGTVLIPLWPSYSTGWTEGFLSHRYSTTLSEESPAIQHDIVPSVTRVELFELRTNGTYVSIMALGLSETYLHLRNVSEIVGVPVVIERPSVNDWWINVTWQGQDVAVSLKIREWHIIPPLDVVSVSLFASNIGVLLLSFGLSVYAGYRLILIEGKCRRQSRDEMRVQVRWSRRQGSLAVVLLILLCTSLFAPFLRGYYAQDYRLVKQTTIVSDQLHSVFLNESHSEASFNLTIPYSSDSGSYAMRVHSITHGGTPVLLRISYGLQEEQMVLANATIDGQWWLSFPEYDTLTHTLSLDRIENDVEIRFFVEISRDVYFLRVDPLPALAVASLGILPLSYALLLARRLDLLLKTEERPHD
ncbi:MAG: hypothetical protein V3U94_05820 [Candidatus Thorarchaeota archaeon]